MLRLPASAQARTYHRSKQKYTHTATLYFVTITIDSSSTAVGLRAVVIAITASSSDSAVPPMFLIPSVFLRPFPASSFLFCNNLHENFWRLSNGRSSSECFSFDSTYAHDHHKTITAVYHFYRTIRFVVLIRVVSNLVYVLSRYDCPVIEQDLRRF